MEPAPRRELAGLGNLAGDEGLTVRRAPDAWGRRQEGCRVGVTGVGEETARTHVRDILRKLHLKSRSKLVKS